MYESVGKAELLLNHCHSEGFRESVDLPLTCHPSPCRITYAFRSTEVRHLFLDLDPYGDTDPLGMFPRFLQRTADVLAPRLSVVFRRRLHLCTFPACSRQANVAPISKGPPSSSVCNYRSISIASVLSMVFEHLVTVRFGRFIKPISLLIGNVCVLVMQFCSCLIHYREH